MRATQFNITIIQVYALTATYEDCAVEAFYDQLQTVLDQIPNKYIIIVQDDWNAKVGEDAYTSWRNTCGPYGNINDRGLGLLTSTYGRSSHTPILRDEVEATV